MHLAKLAAFLSTGWTRLKSVLGKMAPRGFSFVMHKKSCSGDELDVVFSTYDADTVARLLQGFSAPLLKQLPAAVGSDYSRALHAPVNTEPLPPLCTTASRFE